MADPLVKRPAPRIIDFGGTHKNKSQSHLYPLLSSRDQPENSACARSRFPSFPFLCPLPAQTFQSSNPVIISPCPNIPKLQSGDNLEINPWRRADQVNQLWIQLDRILRGARVARARAHVGCCT
ncbi:hypothetical protein DAI22_11g114600 [Oryza sativa Japonica Group]|nr:hypothetical protein DAI22_11g114600 [Oryza sativa Japonica Group]